MTLLILSTSLQDSRLKIRRRTVKYAHQFADNDERLVSDRLREFGVHLRGRPGQRHPLQRVPGTQTVLFALMYLDHVHFEIVSITRYVIESHFPGQSVQLHLEQKNNKKPVIGVKNPPE